MPIDLELTRDLMDEDLPAAQRQAQSLGLALERGNGSHDIDLYIWYTATDEQRYCLRLRCDGYDEVAPSFQFVNPANREELGAQWWPRMQDVGYARDDRGEVIFCTPGTREYHQHSSHRSENHPKTVWKLARVVALSWRYLYGSGPYLGRGGM